MNRSTLPLGVGALYKYWTSSEQTLRCSLNFQRNSGMWNLITKSSLVASVLSDSFIPAVVFLKDKVGTSDKGKDICRYEILDGQQRLTSLFEFLDDRWALHGSIEPIEFDGFTYDIAGKKFSELEPELQDAIKGYRFSIQALENYTFSEVEKLFFNINSGVALSTIQKAKPKLGNENMEFFNKLLSGNFFTQAINITEAQAKREDDLLLLLQTMLLLDNRHEGREYKNISAATCLAYAESVRNTCDGDKKNLRLGVIEYLDEAFPAKIKFLRKNNVPIVGVCAEIAMEQGAAPKDFKTFICEFSNNIYPAYEEASGSGNIKAPKVQQRLRVMFLAMCQYFGWDAEKVRKPFADEIPLYPDGPGDDGVGEAAAADPNAVENSNLPGDAPADGVPVEDAPGSEAPEGENASSDSDMDHEGDPGVDEGLMASGGGETDGSND